MSELSGVLVVDKPGGMTSAAVVARVKHALGAARVGHTGTLDPMATGVLPLCVGSATKLAQFLLADDKAYEGELELGVETDTLDREGTVVRRDPEAAAAVTADAVRAAMAEMTGASQQTPPMFSAIKQDGVRLHELARQGRQVERAPRPIRVDRFEATGIELPRVRFAVDCSKGTYVRVLVSDLGRALGCGAHLTALRRIRSGAFTIAAAVPLDRVAPGCALIGIADAVGHLPEQRVPAAELRAIANGQPLAWSRLASEAAPAGIVRLVGPDGELLALASVENQRLRYLRVFPQPER